MFGLRRAARRSVPCCSGGGNVLVGSSVAAPSFSGLAERKLFKVDLYFFNLCNVLTRFTFSRAVSLTFQTYVNTVR
jgi:hypothetical protein